MTKMERNQYAALDDGIIPAVQCADQQCTDARHIKMFSMMTLPPSSMEMFPPIMSDDRNQRVAERVAKDDPLAPRLWPKRCGHNPAALTSSVMVRTIRICMPAYPMALSSAGIKNIFRLATGSSKMLTYSMAGNIPTRDWDRSGSV